MLSIGRKRAMTQGPTSTPEPLPENVDSTGKISLYEQSREDRIRENKERLQKLGIVELSEKLRPLAPKRTPQRRESSQGRATPLLASAPSRRSSRLQNVTPVSYTEIPLKKKEAGDLANQRIVLEEGAKPEVYMEEHEKLLGNTGRSWELFVDGYGKDGKRIYDSFKGKTCHQCRQKTLGHRTQCCKCNMVQGQFCGDCLYMRYGEHVLEALENPNWICPVCRGICNCSLCRQAKGWPPTGTLYKKISRLGYKSVAHFLIQTRRAQPKEETPNSVCHSSVKRALPFSESEDIVTEVSHESHKDEARVLNGKTEEAGQDGIHIHEKWPLSFTSKEAVGTVSGEGNANKGLLEPKVEGKPDGYKSENGQEVGVIGEENHATPKRKYALSMGSNQDSIGARLRQRRTLSGSSDLEVKENSELEVLLSGSGTGLDTVVATDHGSTANTVEGKPKEAEEIGVIGEENHATPKRECALVTGSNQDSIGARLRQRRTTSGSSDLAEKVKNFELEELNGSGMGLDVVVATNHVLTANTGSNQDSIGVRLRQRRRMQSGNNDLVIVGVKDLVNGSGKRLGMSSGTE